MHLAKGMMLLPVDSEPQDQYNYSQNWVMVSKTKHGGCNG